MSQPTNTASSYKFNTIREDLEDFVYKISPLETPIMQSIGRKGKFDNTYHEWPVVELAAANGDNAHIEGDDAFNDAPTTATRHGNYAQLMNKVAQVSSTAERIRGAGSVQRMAKQILYKTQEMKRDMEARIGANVTKVAVAGSDTVARQTASIAAFLQTNVDRGSGGSSATLSGTTNGYPSVAGVPGSNRTLTETLFKAAIQSAWTQGGKPTYAFVSGSVKVVISAFSGNSTRFKKAEDKKLIAAIDVYESDFGQLQIVPDRFMNVNQVLIIDPAYAEVGWLQGMSNMPLAKTGNSERRLIASEWGVVVGNEKAHATVADVTSA